MMKTMTAALAGLLLAGASTQALAQDQDHDRGDRGQGRPAQAAAPAAHAAPQAAPQATPRSPQDGHARFGAPPPSGQPPAAAAAQVQPGQNAQRHDFQGRGGPRDGQGRDGQGRDGQGRDGQRFQGAPQQPQAQVPAAPNGQRFDRGQGGQGGPGGGRQFDRERGPREVIPGAGDRGFDGRRDGRDGRDGRGDGNRADGRDHRDGANPWRRGDRWQAGRAPPVFWSQDRFRIGAYRAPYGYYVRSWGFGDFLPRGWYGQDYFIGDFLDYDLPYPPPGYEWVRVGGDALMIDRFSGRVVQVVRGIFW
jgi:hypothetical protein